MLPLSFPGWATVERWLAFPSSTAMSPAKQCSAPPLGHGGSFHSTMCSAALPLGSVSLTCFIFSLCSDMLPLEFMWRLFLYIAMRVFPSLLWILGRRPFSCCCRILNCSIIRWLYRCICSRSWNSKAERERKQGQQREKASQADGKHEGGYRAEERWRTPQHW